MSSNSINIATTPLYSTNRSLQEIEEELQPTLEKIKLYIEQKATIRYVSATTGKKFLASLVKNPALGCAKAAYSVLVGYMLYLLIKGTLAGIVVDFESSFTDLFSKDKTKRLNAGLDLTNGEQAGQFMNDGLKIAYTLGYYILLKKPYNETMTEIITEGYEYYLDEMKRNDDLEKQLDEVHLRENHNRLYKLLQKELAKY